MYDYVQGELVAVRDGHAVIEAGGVGYELAVPASTLAAITGRARVRLYTVMRLREERLQLFGFATVEERATFLSVCAVSGVGPATALALLSGLTLAEFREAVESGRPQALQRVKGIGKKTAERLVLELKGSLGSVALSDTARSLPTGIAADVVQMLVTIQYDEAESVSAVRDAIAGLPPGAGYEEVFCAAQRLLGGRR